MAQPVSDHLDRKHLSQAHQPRSPPVYQERVDAPNDEPSETNTPETRNSVRFSTYSMAPSFTPTVQTSDSAHAEIRDIAVGLDRMENKALSSQRVVLSEEKTDTMSKLALGAKLERALDRRMSGQDAVMRPRGKSLNEKYSEKYNEKV
ncbi:Fc.00g074490.m01.CDS01 [Cosmosporella sp. VM-42]